MSMPTSDYTLILESTTPILRAATRFPSDFPGFDGHFPNNPLLPGFMHIQLAVDLLAAANLPHTLRESPPPSSLAP
jgi:3-hydroxymyristoyl/3-hydroxydecanoyl-(acyl carrier protein) dehydratase